MTKKQRKMREVWLNTLKRQEKIDNFCDACVRLAPRDRLKVERFLKRLAHRETETQSDYLEQWTKNHMRACYHELRDISPKVANAWRLWALVLLKTAPPYYCFTFRILVESLDWRMRIEKFSDDTL
jgi:hypothetical protein